MKDDEVLVVKCGVFMSNYDLKKMHDDIVEEIKTGVVVLPAYCSPVIVPEDVKIEVRDGNYGTV